MPGPIYISVRYNGAICHDIVTKPGTSCGAIVGDIIDIHDVSEVILNAWPEGGVMRKMDRKERVKLGCNYLVLCSSGMAPHSHYFTLCLNLTVHIPDR
jgi:hypothetical protein